MKGYRQTGPVTMAEPGGFCIQAVQGDSKHRMALLAQVSLPSRLESDIRAMSHGRLTHHLGSTSGVSPVSVLF